MSEKETIYATIKELDLDPDRDRSEIIRLGTLLLCGEIPNHLPEKIQKHLDHIIWKGFKIRLLSFLGPENGSAAKIRKKATNILGKE